MSFSQGITTSKDTAYLPFVFSKQLFSLLLSFHALLLYSDENVSLVSTWSLRDIWLTMAADSPIMLKSALAYQG